MARHAAVLLLTLLLAACAAPQPSLYAPMAGRDGYGQEHLGKGLYRVWFQGNAATARERVQNYCLYRAAELTLELRGEGFAVHDKQTEQYTLVTREYHDDWRYRPYGRYGHYPHYPGAGLQRERTTFRAILTIEPFSGRAPGGGFQIYDARAVIEQFGARIERPAGR
jgi:hypothetical protein